MEKNFMLRCSSCRWGETTTGLSVDLAKFTEVKSCPTCGGTRKFKCPKCGGIFKMKRIRGNTPPPPPQTES